MTVVNLTEVIMLQICTVVLVFAQDLLPSSTGVSRQASNYGCPQDVSEPMVAHGGYCYMFVPVPTTWPLARDECRSLSRLSPGRLVSVPDAAMQSWLEAQMRIRGWTGVQGVWLGLNNRSSSGRFTWEQQLGQGDPALFTNWASYAYGRITYTRSCVYMRPASDWKWVVAECHLQAFANYSYICQFSLHEQVISDAASLVTANETNVVQNDSSSGAKQNLQGQVIPTVPTVTDSSVVTNSSESTAQQSQQREDNCPSDIPQPTVIHHGVCNKFVSQRMKWPEAQAHCRNLSGLSPGRLVNVPDADVQEWLVSQIHRLGWNTTDGVWLGLNDRATEGHFVWDQYNGQGLPAFYTNWMSGEPSSFSFWDQDCVIMSPKPPYKWEDVRCDSWYCPTHFFVCQYPLVRGYTNSFITTSTKPTFFSIQSSHPSSMLPFLSSAEMLRYSIAKNPGNRSETTASPISVLKTHESLMSSAVSTSYDAQTDKIREENLLTTTRSESAMVRDIKTPEDSTSSILQSNDFAATSFELESTPTDEQGPLPTFMVRDIATQEESTSSILQSTVVRDIVIREDSTSSILQSNDFATTSFELESTPTDEQGPLPTFMVRDIATQEESTSSILQSTTSLERESTPTDEQAIVKDIVTLEDSTSSILQSNDFSTTSFELESTPTDEQGPLPTSMVRYNATREDSTSFILQSTTSFERESTPTDKQRLLPTSLASDAQIKTEDYGRMQELTSAGKRSMTEVLTTEILWHPMSSGVDVSPAFVHQHPQSTVNGEWSAWSSWSACRSNLCSDAYRPQERYRRRECNNPEPRYGGQACDGLATETELCSSLCGSVATDAAVGSEVAVSCTNRTSHPYFGLRGIPSGFNVGARFTDAYCTAERPLITWRCDNTSLLTAQWIMIRNESCPRNEEIQRLAQVNLTYNSVSSILKEVVNATSSSAVVGQTFGLAVADVTFGSQILNSAISLLVHEPKMVALAEVIATVPAIVSNILEAPVESLAASNTSASISRNVEALLNVATLELQENSTVTHVQPNLIVKMTSDPAIVGIEVISDGALNAGTVRPVRAGDSSNREQAEAVVFFALEAKDIRKSFAVFNNSKLFQGKKMFPASEKIISAQLTETISHPELVTILFKLPTVQNKTAQYDDVECGFWNYAESDWSTFGCKKTPALSKRIACFCNHTTNFAVLFRVHETSVIETVHSFALSTITRVGLSVSTALLLVVIISFLLFRKLRRTSTQKVLFNVSLSICLLDVFFLIGIERTENAVACIAFAALIHVFLLSSFTWMSVEATLQYLKLVKIFAAIPLGFFTKSAIFAWGLPLLTVSSLLVADFRFYDKSEDGICWIQSSVMHYGVLLPVSLSIAYNGVMFFLVARSLIVSKSLSVRSTMSATERLKLRARAGFAVFVLLGLTWTFGYFAIHGAQLAFQYLFCIFNSIQGALIALFHCILGKLLPRELRRLLRRASSKEYWSGDSRTTTFSSSSKSSVNRRNESTRL